MDPAASPTGAGKPSPTFAALFEAALVGQTSTSPASKKFPKLSQRQRKMTQVFFFQSFLHFVPLFLGFVLSDFAEGKIFFNHRIVAFVYSCVIVTFLNCMGFNL